MSSAIGAIVTMLVGIAALLATFTGTYTNYVKPGLRWPLVLAGLILVVLGASTLIYRVRDRGTRHAHVESIGLLLLVFVAALALAPPPLGADAVGDRTPNRIGAEQALPTLEPRPSSDPEQEQAAESTTTVVSSTENSDPPVDDGSTDGGSSPIEAAPLDRQSVPESAWSLDSSSDVAPLIDSTPENVTESAGAQTTGAVASDEVYALDLYDLIGYVYFDPEAIRGAQVQIVGFAAPETTLDEGFRLTIYMMSCCALDAYPLQVALVGAPFIPANDQWVVAEAVWDGEVIDVDEFGEGVPVLRVVGLEEIEPPADPYGT